MKHSVNRRTWLRTVGTAGAGAVLGNKALAEILSRPASFPQQTRFRPPDKPITAIVAGAGNRGNVYGNYALKFPQELKIVGFAEPVPFRSERYAKKHDIDPKNQFITWEHIFDVPKFADAVIITTPDALHYGPAMAALEMGYDLLLEKPIAQTWPECRDIMKLTQNRGRIVAVCHVLRYAPLFKKVKEVIASGALGRLLSIDLIEPVEHLHMSHSFVRGNWRNSKESNPMLLAKSCHDLDLLRWYTGTHCKRVSSFGHLSWFKKENAPAGSTLRCTDGCAVESECPYSALEVYYRNRQRLHVMDIPEEGDKGPVIMDRLKNGPYGRCVYHCDNDVVDHQVVAMEFDKEITASFSMEAFTSYWGRRIKVMGSMGDIVGELEDLVISDFTNGKSLKWNVLEHADVSSGHGGGDYGLVRDWIQAVSQQNPEFLSTDIASAMESHLMAFRAEESRLTGTVKEVGAAE
jgi:predicted dehydrogenase